MRVTAFSLILFYVCLNLSLYFVGETEVLPESAPPVSSPQNIQSKLGMVVGGLLTLSMGFLIGWFTGYLFLGATAALILFGVQYLLGVNNVIYWAFFGLPEFINRFAATTELQSAQLQIFQNVVLGLSSVVWFWFILSFVTQRQMET